MDSSFQEFTATDIKKVAQDFAIAHNAQNENIKYKYLNHTLVIEQDEYGNGGTYAKVRVCLQRIRKSKDYHTNKSITIKDKIFADEYW